MLSAYASSPDSNMSGTPPGSVGQQNIEEDLDNIRQNVAGNLGEYDVAVP